MSDLMSALKDLKLNFEKIKNHAEERKRMLILDGLIKKYGSDNKISFNHDESAKANLFQCIRTQKNNETNKYVVTIYRFDSEEEMDNFMKNEKKENSHKCDDSHSEKKELLELLKELFE